MKTLKTLLMLFTVGIVFGCSTTLQTVADYDKGVDFSRYKTYSFYDKGLEKIRLNNLDKRRLMAAVETELSAKGFTKADKPDFLVNLVVVSREAANHYGPNYYGGWGWGRGWGWGWGSPFFGGNTGYVDTYREGTIIIDFLDPGNKTLFWHGRGAGFNLDNFRKREERLHAGVSEILRQYPPSVTTSK